MLLAQAFVHGRIAIDWPGEYIDALPYAGAHFVIEAPLPAALLVPWVALFGTANQTVLALLLCAAAIGLCWLCCEHLELPPVRAAWICAFAFAGTQLWWCAMLGDVWMIAHVAAVACTFLALAELTGRRRGWLVALAAVGATFSRFSLLLAIPVYAWLLLHEHAGPARRRVLVAFGGVIALGAVVWVAYNVARWGVWYDIGYTEWYHQDRAGSPDGSPFRPGVITDGTVLVLRLGPSGARLAVRRADAYGSQMTRTAPPSWRCSRAGRRAGIVAGWPSSSQVRPLSTTSTATRNSMRMRRFRAISDCVDGARGSARLPPGDAAIVWCAPSAGASGSEYVLPAAQLGSSPQPGRLLPASTLGRTHHAMQEPKTISSGWRNSVALSLVAVVITAPAVRMAALRCRRA